VKIIANISGGTRLTGVSSPESRKIVEGMSLELSEVLEIYDMARGLTIDSPEDADSADSIGPGFD
jgi:hypothetical protein